MPSYKPVHEHIIVRRKAPETTTEGGLIIPDDNQEKPAEGEVLAVGSGYRTPQGIVPLEVKKGDYIVFGKYSGNDVRMNGEDVAIIKEDEILAVRLKDSSGE